MHAHRVPTIARSSLPALPWTQVSEDELYVVVNAGCRDKDLAHLNKHLSEWKVIS